MREEAEGAAAVRNEEVLAGTIQLGRSSPSPLSAIELVIVKKKVRPHPGPLPQERETRRALEKFVNSMAVPSPLPLSPGERGAAAYFRWGILGRQNTLFRRGIPWPKYLLQLRLGVCDDQ